MEPVSPVSAIAGARQIEQYRRRLSKADEAEMVIFEVRRNPGDVVDLGSRRENAKEEQRNRVLADLGIGRRFNTIG